MGPILFALPALSASAAQQPPNFHPVPPSAMGELATQHLERLSVVRARRRRCVLSENPSEIVVCGRDESNQHRIGAIDQGMERRFGRRPEGPSAGVQMPSDAVEAGRCTITRCAPKPMIGIFTARF